MPVMINEIRYSEFLVSQIIEKLKQLSLFGQATKLIVYVI